MVASTIDVSWISFCNQQDVKVKLKKQGDGELLYDLPVKKVFFDN